MCVCVCERERGGKEGEREGGRRERGERQREVLGQHNLRYFCIVTRAAGVKQGSGDK